MAAHTLLGGRGATAAKQTADMGVCPVYRLGENNDVVQVKNGEAATNLYFKAMTASHTGYVKMRAIPNDGACVVIADGISVPDIYEFDVGTQAAGTITIAAGNAADGDEITIDDGVNPALTFEFDDGVIGNDGQVTIGGLGGNAQETDTLEFTGYGLTFEFDEGVRAYGTLEFICQPADGQTLTLDDGVNTPVIFEFDDTAAPSEGTITIATVIDGDSVTIDDVTHGTLEFEFDEGAQATGSLALAAGNATAGDTITMNDGVHGDITFTAGGAGTYDFVVGANNLLTMANLQTVLLAAQAAGLMDITPVNGGAGTINFTNDLYSDVGNQPVTVVEAGAVWTPTNLTGGAVPGAGPIAGDVAVPLGATDAINAANLITAIQTEYAGGSFDILASAGATTDVVNVRSVEYGVAFDMAMVENTGGTTIVVADGPGVNAVVTGTNTPVEIRGSTEATASELNLVINWNNVPATFEIHSTDNLAGTLTVENDTPGVFGNTTTNTTSHAIIENNMTGGLDAGDGDYTPGNIPVAIGATAADTCDNLYTVLVANVPELVGSGHAAGVLTMLWDDADTAANTAIAFTGTGDVVVDSNMTNGATPGTDITPGNVGVALGATNLLSGANLLAVIQAQKAAGNLDITATAPVTDNALVLVNDAYLAAGNVAIVETGANISATGMAGGADPTGAVSGTHIAVTRAATATGCLTNLSAAIIASGSAVVTPGTQYTEVDAAGTTWYVLPITGTYSYSTFGIDQDTTSYAAGGGNMIVSLDDSEYKQNGIGVVQMDGNYYAAGTGWREVPYVDIAAYPAQSVQLTETDDYTSAVTASTSTYLGVQKHAWAQVGDISARIIVVPRLVDATTTHGAFAAGGDVITATGVVTNR